MPEIFEDKQAELSSSAAYNEFDLLLQSQKNDELREFISNRATELSSESHPHPGSMTPQENNMWSGYISPDTEIRQQFFSEGFQIDDPELLDMFFNIISKMKEKNPEASSISLIINAVNNLVKKYFGGGESNKNNAFTPDNIVDGNISIEKLRFKGDPMCIVKATLAQQFLSLAGVESICVFGGLGEPENPHANNHAFNLFLNPEQKKWQLLDLQNPLFVGANHKKPDQALLGLFDLENSEVQNFLEQKDGHIDIGFKTNPRHKIPEGKSVYGESSRSYYHPVDLFSGFEVIR